MNAGFANLYTLKAQILAGSLRTRTDFDAQLLALGLGVAAAFDTHCNRHFARLADDFHVTTGGRQSLIVPRLPLEEVAVIETRDTIAAGWTDETAALATWSADSGVVRFTSSLDAEQIRVTFTGGYHWETKEPTDAGYPTAIPSGAATIPADVLSAWFLQVETIWRAKDKLGTEIAKEPSSSGGTMAISSIELIPTVKQMLAGYVRYNLT